MHNPQADEFPIFNPEALDRITTPIDLIVTDPPYEARPPRRPSARRGRVSTYNPRDVTITLGGLPVSTDPVISVPIVSVVAVRYQGDVFASLVDHVTTPEPMDPDTAVMLEIEAHETGTARGLRFRMAEDMDAIADLAGLSVSPCGIHLYPAPVRACRFCAC